MEPWRGKVGDAPTELLRALSDPLRRRLLERLVAGPATAGDLARHVGLPRVNVSHHLGVLAAAGLIDQRHRRAAVRPEGLARLRRYFDLALTAAAISLPASAQPVAGKAQI